MNYNITSDTTGSQFILNAGDVMQIFSNGITQDTIIKPDGTQTTFTGGIANDTIIDGGWQSVSSGGVVNGTIVNSDGWQSVSNGGVANRTTVNSDGWQYISSGGVVNRSIVNSSGYQYIASGGIANGDTINGGYQTVARGGVANSTTINSDGRQVIGSSGAASNTIINFGGQMSVSSGGTALGVVQNSGGAIIAEIHGNDSQTQVTGTHENGSFYLNNGVAYNFLLNAYARQYVFSGGTASRTVVNSEGSQYISNGGVADGTVVNADGHQIIFSGGVVRDTIVNSGGSQRIYSSGLAANTTVSSGGSLFISSGGSHSGVLNIHNGAIVSAIVGANIDFTVANRKAGGGALVSNYELIQGQANASYTITVDAKQKSGIYKLASEAARYNYSTTVKYTNGTALGTLSVGGSLVNGDYTYSLSLTSGNLNLTVKGPAVSTPKSDLLSNGYSQIVAWDSAGGKVGYVATNGESAPSWRGIWEWGGSEAAMWKVVAVGSFSEDVAHDGILLYNGYGNTFAAWTDLGRGADGSVSLCHVEGNFQTLGLADFDNNGLDDVIIYDENGSFGIVSDARTYHDVWHVDNPLTNVQKVIGAGYFGNADGKSDILVKKTDENAYFLWHNQDPTFNTWNWSQTYIGTLDNDWTVAAIGDFQGDGIDDIIMWQKSTGFMYAWEDGKSSNQRWVGALDASQWEVAAVGDYNGDGKEDLLLRELVSGWGGVGYWGAGSADNWTDLNARIETDMESKFAIIA